MNNHIKLLSNQIGGNKNTEIFDGGFPNLVLNDKKNRKIEYKYNIETNINKDIINIKNILEKRKEENTPIINLVDDDYEYSFCWEREAYYTPLKFK